MKYYSKKYRRGVIGVFPTEVRRLPAGIPRPQAEGFPVAVVAPRWEKQADHTPPVSKDILDKAIELGVNFLDTAEAYPNSEEVLGRILQGRRKDLIIATKFGQRVPKYTAADIEQSLTTSLQRLQTDYIDLYQVHWPIFISDYKEVFDELKRQQARGRIRHYAVCNFGAQNLADALAVGAQPISNQIMYNLLWRPIEYEILPKCLENNIAILPYSPLQQGLLSGKYLKLDDVPEGRRRTRLFNASSTSLSKHGESGVEKQLFHAIAEIKKACGEAGTDMSSAALAWLLKQETVHSVIVGASTPDQVVQNANLIELKQELVGKLTDITNELKSAIGNHPDPWLHDSRIA